jgi:hypothetical protein
MEIRLELVAVAAVGFLTCGCVTTEVARFQARPGQEAIVRDGQPAIVSRKSNSIVLVRPAKRQFQSGQRPVYVMGLYNAGRQPVTFTVSSVSVDQTDGSQLVRPLKVYTYEELVQEERNRQVAAAILVGLAGVANAAAASQAGRYNSTATVYTPRGVSTVRVSGYDPVAAGIAQDRAAAQNEAMISGVIERGQQNLASLESEVIKDNTMMPGEWYGGQLQFDPPQSDGVRSYRITIQIGAERHEVDIVHEKAS